MKIRGLMLTGKVLSISSFFTFLLICVNAAELVKSTNYTERISKKKKKKNESFNIVVNILKLKFTCPN